MPKQADPKGLEACLSYEFKDKALLLKALTHKSYHHENPTEALGHNERLEFLGDSVLSLVLAHHVFEIKDKQLSEADMSRARAYAACGATLNEAARDISLGDYLRVGRGEEETGGRRKASIVSDALEAVIGAVYLDGGLPEARNVVMLLLGDKIEAAIAAGGGLSEWKTLLQQRTQLTFEGLLPQYCLMSEQGSDHDKTFTVDVLINGETRGTGKAKTKKEAEGLAAKQALEAGI